jgi:hypothetical protein
VNLAKRVLLIPLARSDDAFDSASMPRHDGGGTFFEKLELGDRLPSDRQNHNQDSSLLTHRILSRQITPAPG